MDDVFALPDVLGSSFKTLVDMSGNEYICSVTSFIEKHLSSVSEVTSYFKRNMLDIFDDLDESNVGISLSCSNSTKNRAIVELILSLCCMFD